MRHEPDEYVPGWSTVLVLLLVLAVGLLLMFSPRPAPAVPDWSGHQTVIEQWTKEARR